MTPDSVRNHGDSAPSVGMGSQPSLLIAPTPLTPAQPVVSELTLGESFGCIFFRKSVPCRVASRRERSMKAWPPSPREP